MEATTEYLGSTAFSPTFVPSTQNNQSRWKAVSTATVALISFLCIFIAGCGTGGYPGGGIQSLSRSSATIDAGQSLPITAVVSPGLTLTWSLAGPACTGIACGALSATNGTSVTYVAPLEVSAPMQAQVTATIPGTKITKLILITVNPDPSINGNPLAGTVGVPYSATIMASGGTAPLKLSLSAGTLPAGLTFNAATGVISGTPTAAGSSQVVFSVTDSSDIPDTVTAAKTIVIDTVVAGAIYVTGAPPSGTVGTAYTAALAASGGTAPYTWALAGGALPPGITLGAASGVLSGTPTTQGAYTFTVQAQDANGNRGTGTFTVNISAAGSTLSLTTGTLPNGTVSTPYSATIGVTGGTAPYNCTITSGTLPAGLALGANCLVSGTPTTAGTVTVMVKATDSSNPVQTTTGSETITINPLPLTLTSGTLPNGMVGTPYSATIGVSGGTSPYSCVLVSGALPAGLALGANCLVSGTPTTPGTVTVTVKATDSSNPAQSTTGPETITITPTALSLTMSTLPNGTVGTPYSATIGVTGGTAPYSCAITAGTLPAGLTLGASCLVSGTPTAAGTVTVTVKATDSGNPAQSTTGPETITISASALSLTTGTLPNGVVGTPYSSTIGVTGGTSPYSCTITSGTLPAGLALGANCLVSGTPTAAGTTTVTVKATDSSNPAQSTTGPETITITAGTTLMISSPPTATVNVPYTGTIPVTGGTGPYTCALTAGTLPAGLTLGANCVVSGTPTMAGSVTVTVKGTDSSQPPDMSTGPVTITVNPATVTLTLGTPPPATVGTPYTGVIPVSGGTGPYNCTIASGTLPAGLTLGASCTITGTPTAPGPVTVSVTVTDSGNPPATTTGPVTVTVNPVPPLTLTGSLPNATLNVPYTQTLHAAGGVGPYTYALTAGALPPGITLSTTGVISGTPTAVGASSFTVTATDSEGTPQTASLPLVLLVVYATTTNDAELQGPYAFLFQGYDDVVAGVLAYQTATAGSFTADGTGVISAGELDANHQASAPAGATVPTQDFLGSYTIGNDNRGSLTITTLNPDGTVNHTTTYAISVHAPVAPATTSASGSLIEFDNNNLVGTRGSGTFLQQQAAAVSGGLTGSYAFGLSGDTPCLPACTIGILAGPVASVGQFTTNAGAISAGESDANIASANLADLALSGTYDTPDANGRVQLTMTTSGTLPGVYPQDYAVYIVDATHAFILSTDKHSAYILLAGSAQAQTAGTFTAASLAGPYVGYENAPTNPGLAGVALQNVLNLSTATIFRGTANAGTCTTTNVDEGGTVGLVNGLTGLGSGSPIVNALLGTYQSLGNGSCAVTANGRVVINYPAPSTLLSGTLALLGLGSNPPPPRVAYLSGLNQGYFLETGYAGLGHLELQVGSPYTAATLKGTYVYGTTPAASLASLNGSGVFTADGAGHAATTIDENVGVGTLNLLELGVTGNFNYTLTDPAAGRFLLGTTTVVYAITPNRFVLVDINPATVSPSIALIY